MKILERVPAAVGLAVNVLLLMQLATELINTYVKPRIRRARVQKPEKQTET